MTSYLVTIRTECGLYEDVIDAETERQAARAALRSLVDAGEIDLEEPISYTVEEN